MSALSSGVGGDEEVNIIHSAVNTGGNDNSESADQPTIKSIQDKLKAKEFEIVSIDKRSFVWDHIGRVRDPKKGELDFYACKKCFKTFKITDTSKGSTANLLDHLLKKHGITQKTTKRPADSAVAETTAAKIRSLDSHFCPKSLTKAHSEKIHDGILKLCVDRCLPFDIASCDSMANLIHSCLKTESLPPEERDKVFKPLDASTVRKIRLPQRYDDVRKKVKDYVDAHFSGNGGITFDLWSDKYHKREYIAVTIHFLDESFQLHCYCLACRQITDKTIDHLVISRLIKSILAEYALDTKDFIFVTDSGANVKKACVVNKWNRIACFAHDLHLLVASDGLDLRKKKRSGEPAATAADDDVDEGIDNLANEPEDLEQVRDLIKACRSLVEYFKRGNGQRK